MSRPRSAEFSRKDRQAIIVRAKGRCESCSAALKTGEAEVDHILPVELGGKPDLANGQCLCRVCHAEKTADDVRRIRKSDRQRDWHTGAIRPKQKLVSAGFAPTQARIRRGIKREQQAELARHAAAIRESRGEAR